MNEKQLAMMILKHKLLKEKKEESLAKSRAYYRRARDG